MSVNSSLDSTNPLPNYREREVLVDDSLENKIGSIASKEDKSSVSSNLLFESASVVQKDNSAESAEEYTAVNGSIVDKLNLVNEHLSLKSTSLVFEFDDTSEPPIVKVVDKESGDVIREIPPKKLREIAKALTEIADNMNSSEGVEQVKQPSGIFIDERL